MPDLEREILEWNLVLSLGKVEAFHIRAVDCLIALIGQWNINGIFVEMGQNIGIKFLASVFICGDQDLGNGIIDFCFIIQTKLRCIVTIYMSALGSKRGMWIVWCTPADIEYHIKITCFHIITVGLLLFPVDV